MTKYFSKTRAKAAVAAGQHRAWIGAMWEPMGKLQLNYLLSQGLLPSHNLLDLGCGCFRAGVHIIDYLDPTNYFGIDVSDDLLKAGIVKELTPLGLDAKVPSSNLLARDDFDAAEFEVEFEHVLAQSVFSHLPLPHLRLALSRLAERVRAGGVFHLTAFVVAGEDWANPVLHERGGLTSYPDRDPYHVTMEDLNYVVRGLPWKLLAIEDWNHPRDLFMVRYGKRD